MDVPNLVVRAAFTRMGMWVGGTVGAAIGALTATTAVATEEISELALKINEGRVSFHDVWRATAAVEAGLLSYGILGGALGLAAAPGALAAGVVAAAAIFAAYYKNPIASLDAIEEVVDGISNGDQPWDILGAAVAAYGREVQRQKEVVGSANTQFNSARSVVLQRDPLVLDLDGDGLELTAASGNVLFDHNADGIKTGTGWARPDDGFLVRDLNGNGLIDSGRELFGVDTVKSNGQLATQGFDALADLDSNADGQITSADAAWAQLQVWRDTNQDGISQSGELSGLDALGITRIGINGSSTGPQAGQTINSNRVALSTTFTRNGVNRTVGAIDLEANGFFSQIPPEVVDEAGNPVVITQAAHALPQMNGSGMVRNLRAAMSLTGTQADELEAAVAAFAAAGMTGAQYRKLIGVLGAFSGSRFFTAHQINRLSIN